MKMLANFVFLSFFIASLAGSKHGRVCIFNDDDYKNPICDTIDGKTLFSLCNEILRLSGLLNILNI